MRTAVNDRALSKQRMVFSKVIDVASRDWLAENDFVKAGRWDFDDRYLLADSAKAGIAPAQVRKVAYAIYVGEGAIEELEPSKVWQKEFTMSRVAPTVVGPATNAEFKVLTAQPTLKWKGPSGYTAFALQIATSNVFSTESVIYAVTNFLPAATEDGYALKAPLYVGKELKDDTVYFWRVCELNAKFSEVGDWSAPASFRTAVDSSKANTGYGPLAADVRYYGPATNDLANVIVQLYRTADFTGTPVAESSTFAIPLDWKSIPLAVLPTRTAPSWGYSG